MKFFFIVGESSGDIIAANLIKQLKKQFGDEIECLGVGGPLMEEAGFNALIKSEQISVFGILEVLPRLWELIQVNRALVKEIERLQPDIVITVDFPDFNFILSKSLKKRKIFKGKIVHYVAPSVWAWRPGRAKNISRFLDGILCLFPMEPAYFKKHGLDAAYVGHPLVENFQSQEEQDEDFKEQHSIPENSITLGLFFGSRESELKKLHKIIMTAGHFIEDQVKNLVIIAPTLQRNEFEIQTYLQDFKIPSFISSNPLYKWNAFQACDVAIAVSGTVGLELAYANVPHVITYKLNPITYFILRFMIRVKYAHLANILLDKPVVPEFIQSNCEPEKLAEEILSLMKNKERQSEMRAEFQNLRTLMGEGKDKMPSELAAEFLLGLVSAKKKLRHAFNKVAFVEIE